MRRRTFAAAFALLVHFAFEILEARVGSRRWT
jgi:hypothetical protein